MKSILRCERCGAYGLTATCSCGGERTTVRPAKYSPDDDHAEHRRRARLKQLNDT
jgi:rRNA maturation protein Nop10